MELEITCSRVIRVWWSYLWRNLIAILVSMIVGFIVGFIIGFIMGAMGFSIMAIQLVTAPLGFVIGLAISIVPMKMILGKDFGEFRLVLLAKQMPGEPGSTMSQVIH
jgi:hypothetical protein